MNPEEKTAELAGKETAKDKKGAEAPKELNQEGVYKHTDMVTFKVKYKEGYKGKKILKEGTSHKLHKLHADRLANRGIGSVL